MKKELIEAFYFLNKVRSARIPSLLKYIKESEGVLFTSQMDEGQFIKTLDRQDVLAEDFLSTVAYVRRRSLQGAFSMILLAEKYNSNWMAYLYKDHFMKLIEDKQDRDDIFIEHLGVAYTNSNFKKTDCLYSIFSSFFLTRNLNNSHPRAFRFCLNKLLEQQNIGNFTIIEAACENFHSLRRGFEPKEPKHLSTYLKYYKILIYEIGIERMHQSIILNLRKSVPYINSNIDKEWVQSFKFMHDHFGYTPSYEVFLEFVERGFILVTEYLCEILSKDVVEKVYNLVKLYTPTKYHVDGHDIFYRFNHVLELLKNTLTENK